MKIILSNFLAAAWFVGFIRWAYASTLNEMLWGSELTFGNIAESFGKMITQMLIQQQMLKAMDWLGGIDYGSIGGSMLGMFSGSGGEGAVAAGTDVASNWAGHIQMAGGGIINEHVVGVGFSSGASYEFGEGGVPEAVVPKKAWGGGGSGGAIQMVVKNENHITVESSGDGDQDRKTAEMVANLIDRKTRDIIDDELRVGGSLNNAISRNSV